MLSRACSCKKKMHVPTEMSLPCAKEDDNTVVVGKLPCKYLTLNYPISSVGLRKCRLSQSVVVETGVHDHARMAIHNSQVRQDKSHAKDIRHHLLS